MNERIEIGIDDVYLTSKPQSSVKVMKGKSLVKEWLVDDYRGILEQAIDAACKGDVFEALDTKRVINKSIDLFNAQKITIESKE